MAQTDQAYICQTPEYEREFAAEQEHLTETCEALQAIRRSCEARLAAMESRAGEEFKDLRDELFLGSADADQLLEMQVEYEWLNSVIDQFNLSHDVRAERLATALRLLKKPYFAKVSLQFKPGEPARDLYLGDAGIMDDDSRFIVFDWRSPVAEVYYNQDNGPTSYNAHGRTIHCNLLLRRQFDLQGAQLNAFFDTTVAIQDGLLLAALSKQRGEKMNAITATIQREQNQVIRHPDVPVLLVSGIAGSGKTSVLLQRIAYLFYTYRESLKPEDVYLISPNEVFSRYIDGVLPELGERNPQLCTYEQLIGRIGRLDRGKDAAVSLERMQELRAAVDAYRFGAEDFCDLKVGGEVVISAAQARAACRRHAKASSKHGQVALIIEDLLEQLEGRIKSRMASEEAQGEMADLPPEEQRRLFGSVVFPQTDREFREYTLIYLRDRYRGVAQRIEAAEWLRVDRIGAQLLAGASLTRVEWAYVKLRLTGLAARNARFVMIDEVQDYTQAQLFLLAEYFPRAHFLLLGDQNQAITRGTATFAQVKQLFEAEGREVSECRLNTSYRSTPEITQLFARLMDADDRIEVQPVQRPGVQPVVTAYAQEADYRRALVKAAAEAQAAGGLAAVIAADSRHAERLRAVFEEADVSFTFMDGSCSLPAQGLVLLTVKTAKGLEFDQVIIPDAYAQNYPEEALARHRLYTAISRATQRVTILCQGSMTKLL